jgi:hypothetical protein
MKKLVKESMVNESKSDLYNRLYDRLLSLQVSEEMARALCSFFGSSILEEFVDFLEEEIDSGLWGGQ